MRRWGDDEERDCDQTGLLSLKLVLLLIIAMIIGGTCEVRSEVELITIKDGVDLSGIDRRMWNAVAIVDQIMGKAHITSGREGVHGPASWHYIGRALDFDWPDSSYEEEQSLEAQEKRLRLRGLVLDALGSRYQAVAHRTHLHVELERG